METSIVRSSLARFSLLVLSCCLVPLFCSDVLLAQKNFSDDEVIIIGHNYVISTPYDDGVVLVGKKNRFDPIKFYGVDGTTAMLFLYNRTTKSIATQTLCKTYGIDKAQAERSIDMVLRFYNENKLIFKSRDTVEPGKNIGITKYRLL